MRSNHLWWILFSVNVLAIYAISLVSNAAVVNTKNGSLSGRVIVRESPDRLVVTVLTQGKRLFQFYARDVNSVTASKKVLIGHASPLVSDPDISLATSFILPKGMEIIIIEEKIVKNNESSPKEGSSITNQENSPSKEIDQKWVKVRAWGNVEGWILSSALSDSIVFTPEEKAIPLKKRVTNKDIASSGLSKSNIAGNTVSATGDNSMQK